MNIKALEQWYEKNQRPLVFRKTKDPYQIWISEIMLQQTQVDTVIPFFEKFIKKYPTVFDLAIADEEVLHKDVEGLGYYRRFRLMHKAAREIVEKYQGIFPKNYNDIIKLPGIGKYTAGAITSIAYNMPYSALDGNVIRVLSRYLNISDDMRIEKNRKILDEINQQNIERATPWIYTQAMMELGATICKPKAPKCESCPIAEHCQAYELKIQEQLPYMSRLADKKEIEYITLVIYNNENIMVVKQTRELLKNMYLYPQYESESIYDVVSMLEESGIIIEPIRFLHSYKHVFTHLVWHMNVYEVRLISNNKDENWIALPKEKLQTIPMAIAHRKIRF